MKYECVTGKWHETSVRLIGRYMISHPWNNGTAIELMWNGSVRVVEMNGPFITQTFKTARHKFGSIDLHIILGLPAPNGHFILLVYDEWSHWSIFNSATDTWTSLNWKPTQKYSNTSFFDPLTRSIYYRIDQQDHYVCYSA